MITEINHISDSNYFSLDPPSSVRISPDPLEFQAGVAAELMCDSGSANPSPVVEWFRDDELLPSIVAPPANSSFILQKPNVPFVHPKWKQGSGR